MRKRIVYVEVEKLAPVVLKPLDDLDDVGPNRIGSLLVEVQCTGWSRPQLMCLLCQSIPPEVMVSLLAEMSPCVV
eukprot:2550242-Pyramimonas_sp.AAC.1